MRRLEVGLDKGWIPSGLCELTEKDQDFEYQGVECLAWGESTTHTLSDSEVDNETRI